MIAAWLLYSVMIAIAFGVVAALLEEVVRAFARPARFVWLGAVLSTVVVSGLVLRVPSAEHTSVRIAPGPTLRDVRATSTGTADASARARLSRPASNTFDGALLAGWAMMSATSLLLLAGSEVRLRRRRMNWTRAQLHGKAVWVSDNLGPAVTGVWENTIVLPRWVLMLDALQQLLIVEHERQHIIARDPVLLRASLLLAALLPWNVALWLIVGRLRTSMEIDCDARVLRVHGVPRAYAEILVQTGLYSARRPRLRPAFSISVSDLERRIAHIVRTAPPPQGAVPAVLAVTAVAVFAGACIAPRPNVSLARVIDQSRLAWIAPALEQPRPQFGSAGGARASSGPRTTRGGRIPGFEADSFIALARAHYAAIVADPTRADTMLLGFVMDTLGAVLRTATVSASAAASPLVHDQLSVVFPELGTAQWIGAGMTRVRLTPPQDTLRRLNIVYGLLARDKPTSF